MRPRTNLKLCRLLIAAGYDAGLPLEVFRADVEAVRVGSIGAGAALTVAERPWGPVFERWRPFSSPGGSPAMRQTRLAGVDHPVRPRARAEATP